MSRLLDSAACSDPQRAADLAREDAALDVFPELAELSALETARIRADLERNVRKGERLSRANDDHALDLQVQLQGYIGEVVR